MERVRIRSQSECERNGSSQLSGVARNLRLAVACLVAASPVHLAQAVLFQRTAPPPTDQPTIVMVQAFLDQILLGPGKIDGRLGTFTEQAVILFNQRFNLEPSNWWRLLREAQRTVNVPFAHYTIRDGDLKFVGPVPEEPAQQQGLGYLTYRSLAEFVAERFHTTEGFLAQINPGISMGSLASGSVLLVPNVVPFKIEEVPPLRAFGPEESFKERLVYVDTVANRLKITDRGKLMASFPITPGEEKYIPYGDWNVVVMVTTPEFRWDKQMLQEGKRSEEFFQLPPGPNSPVGILWAGLNKSGIGLHGTSNPGTIGRARSAGCIRLSNWDAIRLPSLIRPGTKVVVR
jgi:lipoprotein-anchoring transpeptidase ErfK/SrfK